MHIHYMEKTDLHCYNSLGNIRSSFSYELSHMVIKFSSLPCIYLNKNCPKIPFSRIHWMINSTYTLSIDLFFGKYLSTDVGLCCSTYFETRLATSVRLNDMIPGSTEILISKFTWEAEPALIHFAISEAINWELWMPGQYHNFPLLNCTGNSKRLPSVYKIMQFTSFASNWGTDNMEGECSQLTLKQYVGWTENCCSIHSPDRNAKFSSSKSTTIIRAHTSYNFKLLKMQFD